MSDQQKVILRIKEVQVITGFSRASIYNRISPTSEYFDDEFPKPFKLGQGRAIGFMKQEVDDWISSRVKERVYV
jgi:prophage regulatory protein